MNVNVIFGEHAVGFVAYPVGMKGAVVAQGDSCGEALVHVESAIRFHIEAFGAEAV